MEEVEEWLEPAFWEALCPVCSVLGSNSTRSRPIDPPAVADEDASELRARLAGDGYAHLDGSTIGGKSDDYSALITRLQAAVSALVARGWPASFVLIYDEAWELVQRLGPWVAGATGGNACMMDLVAWHIDPGAGQAGFTPHRDRHLGLGEQDTTAVRGGFRVSSTDARSGSTGDEAAALLPRYCTCWVALSEATPDNGCLYVIPRGADPAYDAGDCTAAALGGGADSFALRMGPSRAPVYVPNTETAWRHVRAVPCAPGSAVLLSHRVIHWGSAGRQQSALGPRLSISFAASDHAFEPPYFDPVLAAAERHEGPLLCLRVALAAGQMLCYAGNDRFALGRGEIDKFERAFEGEARQFSAAYRRKVEAATKAAVGYAAERERGGRSAKRHRKAAAAHTHNSSHAASAALNSAGADDG